MRKSHITRRRPAFEGQEGTGWESSKGKVDPRRALFQKCREEACTSEGGVSVMRSASEFRKGEDGRNMFRCDDQVAHGTYSSLWDGSQTPVAKLRKSMPSP